MKIVIDLTDVGHFFQAHWTVSGIQRVTLRMLRSIAAMKSADTEVKAICIDSGGQMVLGDLSHLLSGAEVDRAIFQQAFSVSPPDQDVGPESLRSILWENAPRNWERKLRKRFRRSRESKVGLHGARLVSSDDVRGATLLVFGGVRPVPCYWSHLQNLKDLGLGRILMTIHDLIPLIRGELVPDDQPEIFFNGLSSACEIADEFLAVSQFTANHLARFQTSLGYEKPIHVVPLAHELAMPTSPSNELFERLRDSQIELPSNGVVFPKGIGIRREIRALSLKPYVLFVGTIEPRKNILALCKAWQILMLENGADNTPILVLAGKKAFGREELDEFLNSTAHLDGLVRLVDAPSDEEVIFLYDHCAFTVFPSIAEGWGLPVGESLWRGKLCVASNAWSIPEVGTDLCIYFDPADLKEIVRVISWVVRNPIEVQRAEEKIKIAELRCWEDVHRDIWNVITADTTE